MVQVGNVRVGRWVRLMDTNEGGRYSPGDAPSIGDVRVASRPSAPDCQTTQEGPVGTQGAQKSNPTEGLIIPS